MAMRDVQVEVGGETKTYSPQEVSAMILAKLKADAEATLGRKDHRSRHHACLLTSTTASAMPPRLPARSPASNVRRIINEPTAARPRLRPRQARSDEKIAVYDLGGGTFDMSVLEIGDGVFEVLATDGDTHLGGDDWDRHASSTGSSASSRPSSGIDLSKDSPTRCSASRKKPRRPRSRLSSSQSYDINLPFITADASGPKHIMKTLSRAQDRADLRRSLRAHDRSRVQDCLAEAKLDASTDRRTRARRRHDPHAEGRRDRRRSSPARTRIKGVNPDEVVAIGAGHPGRCARRATSRTCSCST